MVAARFHQPHFSAVGSSTGCNVPCAVDKGAQHTGPSAMIGIIGPEEFGGEAGRRQQHASKSQSERRAGPQGRRLPHVGGVSLHVYYYLPTQRGRTEERRRGWGQVCLAHGQTAGIIIISYLLSLPLGACWANRGSARPSLTTDQPHGGRGLEKAVQR